MVPKRRSALLEDDLSGVGTDMFGKKLLEVADRVIRFALNAHFFAETVVAVKLGQ